VGTRSLNSFLTRSSQCVEKQVMISIAIVRIVVASTPASFGTLLSSITMDRLSPVSVRLVSVKLEIHFE
jgi:hypothetical protein